jgi:hypothetical protein
VTGPVRPADGPDVLALAPGVVVLRGRVLVDVARAVTAALAAAERLDGLVAPPRLVELRRTLDREARAVAAASGRADVPGDRDLAESMADVRHMSTKEAGELLKLSTRQVRRLAADLGAHKVAARWLIPCDAAAALSAERMD